MPDSTTITREELLKRIDELTEKPSDKGRILGEIGIAVLGAGGGAAAAGTLAAAMGTTSIAGITYAASLIGLSVVAATPVGWVIGCAAGAGSLAYLVSRLIRGGSLAEGRKKELLQTYLEQFRKFDEKERASNITSEDRTELITALRELVVKDAISPISAFRLIDEVENGRIAISTGFSLIRGLLLEAVETNAPSDQEFMAESPEDKAGSETSILIQDNQGVPLPIGMRLIDSSSKVIDGVKDATLVAARSVGETTDAAFSGVGKWIDSLGGWLRRSSAENTETANNAAPVIWLLGKTGAGKSAIVATLTGDSRAKVGTGYKPETKTACVYDFPSDVPLIRFLDTRGLGEPGYDPAEDLAWHAGQAHVIVAVMKVGDPSQETIVEVVRDIRKHQPKWPLLVVHTGLHERYGAKTEKHIEPYPFNGTDEDLQNPAIPRELRSAMEHQRKLFCSLKGSPPVFIAIDFTVEGDGYTPLDYGKGALTEGVLSTAPDGLKQMLTPGASANSLTSLLTWAGYVFTREAPDVAARKAALIEGLKGALETSGRGQA